MAEFISINWLEILGTAAGLVYVYLEIRAKIWLWPVGLFTAAVYVAVYFQHKFYADMGLQVYYAAASIYGWILWAKPGKARANGLLISKAPGWLLIAYSVSVVLLTVCLGWVLDNYTDTPVAYPDAFTSALGIIGTLMLAKKYLEQWHLWILANASCIAIYLSKELYFTSFLFAVYLAMSVAGYIQWGKMYKKQQITVS
jgi:nicotinamide mononucleotide transporter